jgi:serpin B
MTFALDLYERLKETEVNLFFSPYSVSVALAMTYAGARGITAVQMAHALHFPLDHNQLHPGFASLQAKLDTVQEKSTLQMRTANSLWPQEGYPFFEEFLSLTESYYGVVISPLDYVGDVEAARQTINSWTEEKTENKIKNLIPRGVLDDLTRLVLTNAIYFKGNWANQFDQSLTRDSPFSLTSGGQITVPMMMEQREFKYAESDREQVLELPYDGGELSMIVLLPREVDGLTELEETLMDDGLERWMKDLQKTEVLVFLPRFEVMSQFRLNDVLVSMGMVDAFDLKADFSGMDGRKDWLYISAVMHKAFINVNEEGTEAAAATAVVGKVRGMPPPIPTFRADHPFIFFIRENSTGNLLFLGKVVNPVSRAV